jgi:membrane protease YdiL (CAAX protease family)
MRGKEDRMVQSILRCGRAGHCQTGVACEYPALCRPRLNPCGHGGRHNSLAPQGASWRNLGFTKPQNLLATIGLTGLTILAFIMATQLMGLFADRFFEDVNYGTRFDHIEGNLVAYLTIMVVVWTHGSFFEELLFRAFIISNLAHGLGDTRFAFATALIASSVFFGYRHAYYQGIHGALTGRFWPHLSSGLKRGVAAWGVDWWPRSKPWPRAWGLVRFTEPLTARAAFCYGAAGTPLTAHLPAEVTW